MFVCSYALDSSEDMCHDRNVSELEWRSLHTEIHGSHTNPSRTLHKQNRKMFWKLHAEVQVFITSDVCLGQPTNVIIIYMETPQSSYRLTE